MSEGDVSLIRDEDVLRRMWQQTEDFSRKKEIRAHMYRLREERLRDLYSPDKQGKGVESAQTHVQSLLDQSFQGLKSKEVRDAGSPPKDYRGPELKELSNAGWNVESENKTTEDGQTRVRSTTANIEGRYDVTGGAGQFAAVDQQRSAVTEQTTDNSCLKRSETAANTAAHEQVYRKTDDGEQFSSTKTSSSSSQFHQVSSTKQEVPYTNDYDSRETNQERTNTREFEQNLRNYETGELVSRKVDYPDDNTKVIVETRCLPDGTRVTSTRKEFRAPAQTRSEQHSQTRSENRSYSTSHQRSDSKSSRIVSERTDNIVDSQKHIDDYDFKKNQINYLNQKDDNTTQTSHETKRFVTKESSTNVQQNVDNRSDRFVSQKHVDNYDVRKNQHSEQKISIKDVSSTDQINNQHYENNVKESFHREITSKDDFKTSQDKTIKNDVVTTRYDTQETGRRNINNTDKQTEFIDKKTYVKDDNKDRVNNMNRNQKTEELFEKTNDQYQTTYQTDFTQKRVSNDWSPTHQAWASTLRADTPSTKPSTRASSPGSRTYQSSTSSLRSSVSPDKTYRKTPSRGGSPSKADRYSPSRTTDHFSTTHSTHTETRYTNVTSDGKPPISPTRGSLSPDRKPHTRASTSPEKRPQSHRPSYSPERKPGYSPTSDRPRNASPSKPMDVPRPGYSPRTSPEKSPQEAKPSRSSVSPDRKPGYMMPTANSVTSDRRSPVKQASSQSPDRKPYSKVTNIKQDHYKFVDEETKMYTRSDRDDITVTKRTSPSPERKHDKSPSPSKTSRVDDNDSSRPESPIRPTLRKTTRSPSPPKGPVTFEQDKIRTETTTTDAKTKRDQFTDNANLTYRRHVSTETPTDDRDTSPSEYGTYDKKQRTERYEEITTEETDRTKFDSLTRQKTSRISPEKPSSGKPVRDADSPRPQTCREPSPTKYGTYDKKQHTERYEEITTEETDRTKFDSLTRQKTSKISPEKPSSGKPVRDADSPRPQTCREPSPTKYGTYDKKQHTERYEEITTEETDHTKFDSLTRRQKTSRTSPEKPTSGKPVRDADSPRPQTCREPSPTKYGTYDKKRRTDEELTVTTSKVSDDVKYDTFTSQKTTKDKITEVPRSPSQKSPRSSVSPVKSPTKDVKYKATADFIETERTSEKTNKTTATKTRQLVTPSTSPTRKPKKEEPEPSTGQSSPTTSVSGFIYFSSPKVEQTVTDLDDGVIYENVTTNRPDSLLIDRSSPSKIPCRSPSPEKRASPTKGSLPRKSSLKKPVTDTSSVSPVEKPPSSFLVSPADDEHDFPEHKIVKKDRPDKPTNSTVKPKPPLERRETYEERCRKILGMVKDDTTSVNKTTKSKSSSVSPCESPEPNEFVSLKYTDKKETTRTDVTDFITREQEDTLKKTVITDDINYTTKRKTPSRETSPTKLQDIISHKTQNVSTTDTTSTDVTHTSRSKSPQKDRPSKAPTRSSVSPDKKPVIVKAIVTRKTDSDHETGYKESVRSSLSPDRGSKEPSRAVPELTSSDKRFKEPNKPSVSPEKEPGYMRSTVTSTKHESTKHSEDIRDDFISTTECQSLDRETGYSAPKERSPLRKSVSPDRKHTEPEPKSKLPTRPSVSPDRKPGYMKTTEASNLKHEITSEVENVDELMLKTHSRSPSPTKPVNITENVNEFIQTEREQQILDKVQKSLRKLSPNRDQRSPSREKSPDKTTISLQNIDITTSTTDEKSEKQTTTSTSRIAKPKDQKPATKTPSRNASPTKKVSPKQVESPSPKQEKSPEFPQKSRSISPKKPVSSTDRSTQVPKSTINKPREQLPSNVKKTPSNNAIPVKTEKITNDVKKSTNVTKQNSLSKISVSTTKSTTSKLTSPNRAEPENKRAPTPKGNKENVSPKKEDQKIIRTASDASLKNKKISPQRAKSKPEIQINDTTSTSKTTTTKTSQKTSTKLAPKPKSATSLNMSFDEDDIIIDVEQAKSSRETTPDRICPTPVNFADDVSTPRYPDEVKEPDDEFRKRTHHTIHETETIVDDIVEIDEDEELFVKSSDFEHVTESDECLLSVSDKVTKFANKIDNIKKPKDTTTQFKDTERKVHSDFIDETLKSDECLLSVSQKVNKFAKGPSETKDTGSPSRRIVDEYDTETVYQDDYTKLSVNDKAHFFVESAENSKITKTKPAQKVERPNFSEVDESLKSDECMLSVSDKVNKFVKTAEQFFTESLETEDKEKTVREEYERLMKRIVQDAEEENDDDQSVDDTEDKDSPDTKGPSAKTPSFAKETTSSHSKVKDYQSPNLKTTERAPTVKITTLRSSEAVKKAKALFENIAISNQTTKDTKTAKLTDIGVVKKSPKTDSTIVLHPSLEDCSPDLVDTESDVDASRTPTPKGLKSTPTQPQQANRYDSKPRASPSRLASSPDVTKTRSPIRHVTETTTTTKTVTSHYPSRTESPNKLRPDFETRDKSQDRAPKHKPTESKPTLEVDKDKPREKTPSYQRPTVTSQVKEEKTEETEVSTRRGSGKFGVELRRTSVERGPERVERRRGSDQPCIEDVFDLDLLEQMLEKVVGYEQRRRIRAQIRVAKKKIETESTETHTRTVKKTIHTKSPERRVLTKSPERQVKSQKTVSPERPRTQTKTTTTEHTKILNGHAKEPSNLSEKRRPLSPEKHKPSPHSLRQPSPDKKTRPTSPSKTAKPKTNRFSEYQSAYMKKVGLKENEKIKFSEVKKKTGDTNKVRKSIDVDEKIFNNIEKTEIRTSETRSFTERSCSKEKIETVRVNGRRSVSPEKKRSPERTERLQQRSPSPDFKRTKPSNKETIIKTVYEPEQIQTVRKETTITKERPVYSAKKETVKTTYEIENQPAKQVPEEKPSWVTNRNLKKVTSETRTFSKKEPEKKYRAPSPSKVISQPLDVITSSYGPGPLDADGRPLFGIKALRNGASNYQVKGTVVRQEYVSRNGGEPSGSVSVTAYSTEPRDLAGLVDRPSRLHGLAAITTTKRFGGDTGTTLREAHTKEDRACVEQFTHHDRHVDSGGERGERREREDKKTVRQSSVKSLTEKYIKSTSESRSERGTSYPKAGLILRTTNMKDSVSSDSSAHQGLGRTDSEHSLCSVEETTIIRGPTTTTTKTVGPTTTTTTKTVLPGRTQTVERVVRTGERSFLDSSTKVTGVQDILTRMRNADIVIEDGDSTEDAEARALLNKFLGATVLMAGMQGYVTEKPAGKLVVQETVRSSPAKTCRPEREFDPDHCWDERLLRKRLEESTDYEQRRRLRARIRTLMAEQEACTSAVTEALGADVTESSESDAREEKEVTVTSSVRRDSSEKTVTGSTTTKTTKVIESMTRPAPKPVSAFAKFRQLEKQNSTNSPNPPQSPKSPGSGPFFKFTDPALQASAATIKERLLQWCRDKTRDYENVNLENFSTSWADGLAFCALVHHFLPDAFDYSKLTADKRRHNFTLAFKVADEKAGIYPLLDVDDMVAMRKPDWKCVFTYVQSIHRRFKDQQ